LRAGKMRSFAVQNNGLVTPRTAVGYGHKWFFKTHATSDAGGFKIRLDMQDCLLRIDTHPCRSDGDGPQFPELADGVGAGSRFGSRYSNVHVLWMGPTVNGTSYGPWPFPQSKDHLADMGITLHDTDLEANFTLWDAHSAAWHTANGYDADTDTFAWNRQ